MSINMNEYLAKKQQVVHDIFKEIKSAVVLFSGGVDSSLVLKIAREVLKKDVLAVTIDSPFIPRREIEQAETLAKIIGVSPGSYIVTRVELLKDPDLNLVINPVERCYVCKKRIFSLAREIAAQRGLACVVDGTNSQDSQLPRPGLRAARELGIRSPLMEAGFQKVEVRALAQELGLPNWNRPSNSCLATRFPFGEILSREKLLRIEEGEMLLTELGLSCFRLRYHGKLARVHASGPDQKVIMEKGLGPQIVKALRELGFETVTLDLEEYRS
jgi:uncharacterized protein